MVDLEKKKELEKYIGKRVRLFLKLGSAVNLQLKEMGNDYISGIDDEGFDLSVQVNYISSFIDLTEGRGGRFGVR